MPGGGVAPAQARLAVGMAAASRIPAPPRAAEVTTHIPAPPRLPDATETPTPAAVPARAVTMEPIQPEATAATTMADATVAGDSTRLRSADLTARPTQRGFTVVALGKVARGETTV